MKKKKRRKEERGERGWKRKRSVGYIIKSFLQKVLLVVLLARYICTYIWIVDIFLREKYILTLQSTTLFLDGPPNYQCLNYGPQTTTF
jgi:hypothetical protein